MEKRMGNKMETGFTQGLHRDPSMRIIATLGPNDCTYYLHWAIGFVQGWTETSRGRSGMRMGTVDNGNPA